MDRRSAPDPKRSRDARTTLSQNGSTNHNLDIRERTPVPPLGGLDATEEPLVKEKVCASIGNSATVTFGRTRLRPRFFNDLQRERPVDSVGKMSDAI